MDRNVHSHRLLNWDFLTVHVHYCFSFKPTEVYIMVGLGNSRRGMKSPPLLVAALVACIIVLGFNYWIASSRSADLQNRVMELEGRVRRAAAERGAVELKKNEFQGELRKQREQIDKIQSLHNFQMESASKMHRDEKNEYEKLQLDVVMFQKNQTSLQKKCTDDMNQCIGQLKQLNEQCEERIEEISKRGSKIQEKEKKGTSDVLDKNDQVNTRVPTFGQTDPQHNDLTKQGNTPQKNLYISEDSKPAAIVTNVAELEDHREKEGTDATDAIHKQKSPKEDLSIEKDHPDIPSSKVHKELPRDPGIEQNVYEEIRNVLGAATLEEQTGKFPAPGNPMGHQSAHQAKTDEEEIEREQLLNDDLQQDDQETSKDGDLELKAVIQDNKEVDYNLDVNEAESETDKQGALVEHKNNFHAQNLEDHNMQNHLFKVGRDNQQKL
ncbi:Golgi membrane protein 1 isoform X2 [Varanus komodoensis]|uniref:Golgi membrane protein 1 isoform X2 n=1 Tax=Varanus komodoensis TaxID=61221 RepID=UPI001CF7CDFB|nr:Golgi membrane protein 1 isoform X2 [Varanus komodoensis]